ncbi:aldo/keto reductase [Tenacibaculum maritimum]|uniref:aldo/keto reductase n=1 Tax=Tenacibaculum maritimum TaxID=107401 RepID=UPI0012E440B6|nr:aldo/keto reductase [Tenacibaculum maritimum]MCD9563136.1 aldo/keto reductase [Tenacibaculum maritimum]MCD9565459.1 aldo/keto reductase [Tenacibaculum maritimum]MCD9578083.1 aldo/keto reductase [Tenacibaculum maritimum]MCD9585295.1 aldo/keto reductase [Tenacibaculum maritimum]MCD9596025.1 aldo/keto reductase [Tenacibaculum maritimum]
MSKLNKIILGTVQFGLAYGINNSFGKPSDYQVKEILDTAFNRGIKFLDTAEAYGDSQERIGKYHKEGVNRFKVITKYGKSREDLPNDIYSRVKHNLETLGVEELYCYMFHSFKDYSEFYAEFEKDLSRLKDEGLVKKIGVSLHSNEEIEKVLGSNNVDLIQLPFNLLDNSSRREVVLTKAKSLGIEVHTRSVFLQGLFFKELDSLTGNLVLLREELSKIKDLIPKNRTHDLALNYVYKKKFIDGVLLGVDNVKQLEDNINIVENSTLDNENILDCIDNINVKQTEMLNPVNWKR